jgi:hypothetical protein
MEALRRSLDAVSADKKKPVKAALPKARASQAAPGARKVRSGRADVKTRTAGPRKVAAG